MSTWRRQCLESQNHSDTRTCGKHMWTMTNWCSTHGNGVRAKKDYIVWFKPLLRCTATLQNGGEGIWVLDTQDSETTGAALPVACSVFAKGVIGRRESGG